MSNYARFFDNNGPFELKDILNVVDGRIPQGYDVGLKIENIVNAEDAGVGDLTFFHNAKYKDVVSKTMASSCLIREDDVSLLSNTCVPVIVKDPYFSLAQALNLFYKSRKGRWGSVRSKLSSIDDTATISEGCHISDFVSIGRNVFIGENTYIGPNVTILDGVAIGADSYIEPNVTIGFAVIGDRAYIKTGARIGQQGFGFHISESGPYDVLQIGKVIIGDNVQIGANATIDRGSMKDTVVGSNVRIDNMVHLAHNVEVGDFCVIAAQTGVAGSSKIGTGCVFGGQVGVSGHVTVGSFVQVAAKSGIMTDIADKQRVAGVPCVNIKNWHRQTLMLRKLVDNRLKLGL